MNKSTYVNKLFDIFLCFLFYSFMGWFIETIYMSIYHSHIVKRGFLIEPLCVVYGIGTILVVYIFNYIRSHPIIIFLCSSLLATTIELIAGILLEKLLNLKLWDYSENFANFMGYICLQNTFIWGILSLFVLYLIHPVLTKIIESVPIKARELICYSAFICLFLDISISIYTSLKGINNLAWISQMISQRLEHLGNVTSKAVYFIRH